MTVDLAAVLVPVLAAAIISVATALAVAKFSGPAQAAFVAALQGRLAVVEEERDDAQLLIPRLEERIAKLEAQVRELTEALHEKDRELASLYRRLDADERRIGRG